MSVARRAAHTLGRSFFDAVYRRSLIYNQCWEDPAVDRQALSLTPTDRVLVITSAGCNALDYALTGARVTAVDANPRQNHLLELKLAGIRDLEFEQYFALFGEGGCREARFLYRRLRGALSAAAQRYWDREIALFEPARAPGGSFYYAGTAGLVALALRAYIERVARLGEALERVLAARAIEEQVAVYRADLRPRLLSAPLLGCVGSRGVLALLGVPGPQREMVHAWPGGFAAFLRACLDGVMERALLRENYFWSVYLRGRYTEEACPEYLKRPNFEALKAGLAANVAVTTATVTEHLRRGGGPYSAFVLLDHMDWLAPRPQLLEEEWRQIFRAASPGARIIFRSGGSSAGFLPEHVLGRLRFDVERARSLHQLDRVGTYGSFHIARPAAA